MDQEILGHDNAWEDEMLLECYIEPAADLSRKPIFSGRWGSGKSAIAKKSVNSLIEALEKVNQREKIWYIGEKGINAIDNYQILEFKDKIQDEIKFKRALEQLWKIEIIRLECILIGEIKHVYHNPTGLPWDNVYKIADLEKDNGTIWSRLPDIWDLIGNLKKNINFDTNQENGIREILKNNSIICIGKTMREIAKNSNIIVPMMVIEPIDTPSSNFEEGGIAQPLVDSLLNVFYKDLLDFQHPLAWIKICVPWHRYKIGNLDYPNKFRSLVSNLRWNDDLLKEFISRRLAVQMKREGVVVRKDDPVKLIFKANTLIHNEYRPCLLEDNFYYILRHTNHRPRQLLQIFRDLLLKQKTTQSCTINDIFVGKKKINRDVLRDAIFEYCNNSFSEFIEESQRRFEPKMLSQALGLVDGLPNPFEINNLKDRLPQGMPFSYINKSIHLLWAAGIIGVEVRPLEGNSKHEFQESLDHLNKYFGLDPYRCYAPERQSENAIHRWYLFEHNQEKSALEIIKRFESSKEAIARLVVHPIACNSLNIQPNSECPIGA
jgi:hypothetical protein